MKKVLLCVGMLFGIVGLAIASSANHFTETLPPAQAQGSVPVANGYDWSLTSASNATPITLPALSSATIAGLTAATTGQIVFCTTCIGANNALGSVCLSTGSTTTNQFILLSSATAVTACK